MARRRFITLDFWDSPAATSLSAGARLFLIGCWTAADDEGLLRWDAEEFKERFFSTDTKVVADLHVTGWMDEVVQKLLVLPYKDRTGGSYGYLVGFERDQKVSRPVASTLPPPNPRHAATINAYAYRDRGACAACGSRIAPTVGGREGMRAELDGMTGVIVPTDTMPYPSQAVVVHLRCQHGAPFADTSTLAEPSAEQSVETDAATAEGVNSATPATGAPSDLSDPAGSLPPAGATPEDQPMDEVQDSLFTVPAEMTKAPAQKTAKKKRKQPATWTPDRKETAKEILTPWWAKYGEGWPQGYGTVLGVIISVLANKVPADDIIKAMEVLGAERKPIGGGTITFALSHPSKKVREEEAFKERSAARSTDKYQQRTL